MVWVRLTDHGSDLLFVQIEIDPLHEPGYQLRLRAAAANGNLAAVIRIMSDCRAALSDQAGVAPSPETVRVFKTLLLPEVENPG